MHQSKDEHKRAVRISIHSVSSSFLRTVPSTFLCAGAVLCIALTSNSQLCGIRIERDRQSEVIAEDGRPSNGLTAQQMKFTRGTRDERGTTEQIGSAAANESAVGSERVARCTDTDTRARQKPREQRISCGQELLCACSATALLLAVPITVCPSLEIATL
jgi:hypothetical protein